MQSTGALQHIWPIWHWIKIYLLSKSIVTGQESGQPREGRGTVQDHIRGVRRKLYPDLFADPLPLNPYSETYDYLFLNDEHDDVRSTDQGQQHQILYLLVQRCNSCRAA